MPWFHMLAAFMGEQGQDSPVADGLLFVSRGNLTMKYTHVELKVTCWQSPLGSSFCRELPAVDAVHSALASLHVWRHRGDRRDCLGLSAGRTERMSYLIAS